MNTGLDGYAEVPDVSAAEAEEAFKLIVQIEQRLGMTTHERDLLFAAHVDVIVSLLLHHGELPPDVQTLATVLSQRN